MCGESIELEQCYMPHMGKVSYVIAKAEQESCGQVLYTGTSYCGWEGETATILGFLPVLN